MVDKSRQVEVLKELLVETQTKLQNEQHNHKVNADFINMILSNMHKVDSSEGLVMPAATWFRGKYLPKRILDLIDSANRMSSVEYAPFHEWDLICISTGPNDPDRVLHVIRIAQEEPQEATEEEKATEEVLDRIDDSDGLPADEATNNGNPQNATFSGPEVEYEAPEE